MKILVMDDEPLALKGLTEEIRKVRQDCDIVGYTEPAAALEELEKEDWKPDVAFLDIEMPEVNGLAMAKRLKEICPKCNVIFVTSYSQYALNAHSLHASGYLLKPVEADDIKNELENLRTPVPAPVSRVCIQTFGNFDIFVDSKPLLFSRTKAKEALAYIVSRNGGSVTAAELTSVIWEKACYTRSLQSQTQTAISDMMKTLRAAGVADIIVKKRNSISLDVTEVDCDYYRFLKGDCAAVNAYVGEFMNTYSWAEMITGYLSNRSLMG